jgi:dTDP-4-amino-4,6-dideoxygalactose transaminase
LPHTERAAREVLSIPMYAELTEPQLEWVAAAVRNGVSRASVTSP